MWEVFFLGTARKTDSHRSDRIPGMLREIETGCRRALVAMGCRNRVNPETGTDSETRERDILATGAKGSRRKAMATGEKRKRRKRRVRVYFVLVELSQ